MSYSEQPTDVRMRTAGDIAMGQFEAFAARQSLSIQPFGTEHFPDSTIYGPYERYRPDFLVSGRALAEVMCLSPGGDDGKLRIKPSLRLKVQKWEALRWWNEQTPTSLWLYDTAARAGGWVAIPRLSQLLFENRFGIGAFQDEHVQRPFFRFSKDDLRAVWVPATSFVESDWKAHENQ